jgi:hypothetical protein
VGSLFLILPVLPSSKPLRQKKIDSAYRIHAQSPGMKAGLRLLFLSPLSLATSPVSLATVAGDVASGPPPAMSFVTIKNCKTFPFALSWHAD